MIVGTSLFKLDGNTYYTPEFSRGGLAATFVVDTTQIQTSNAVTFQVEHRNAEDTTFTAVGSAQAVTGTGTDQWDVTGLKEIVRIAVSFDAGEASTSGIHFLILPPSWRPY